MEDKESDIKPEQSSSKKKMPKRRTLLVLVILLAVLGVLVWLWLSCQNTKKELEGKNKDLQSEVSDLKKQLANAKKRSADADAEADEGACSDVTDDLRDTIADAVSSENYAALEGHMTNPITVVYAATEFGGPKTPAQAVSALDYLKNGAAPWNFDLPDATLNSYRSGSYEQYFPNEAYVGKSSDGVVVSFVFTCDNINQVFITLHESTLL